MEEDIFDVLNKTLYYMDHDRKRTAKEIASYIEENYYEKAFIEWKDSHVGKTTTSSYWLEDKKFKTLKQVYKCWKENIKTQ